MASSSSNIIVAVRVRPLSAKEKTRGAYACIVVQDGKQINVNDPDDKMGGIDYLRLDKTKDKAYAFDHAFETAITQQAVFEGTAQRVIPDVLRGCNACVFAYGATGSGKTYTMMGGGDSSPGVVLLTVDDIFARISEMSEEHAATVTMQYCEIYNEAIKDLLEPSNTALDVREAPGPRGTFVAGAAVVPVNSRAELEALIYKGNLYRTTEATNVNEVSSRSHAVLQLRFEMTPRFDPSAGTRCGKLSMIDLAGSERAAKTGNLGKRLTEGANINRSLLALANCINALADKTKRNGHVPYRDSKLTRLLKDSLGGHCKTVMITNVSPASDQFEETLNSLKYANRAKNIRTKEVTVMVTRPTPAVEQLAMVRELRDSFSGLAGGGGVPAALLAAAAAHAANRDGTPPAKRGPGANMLKRGSAHARSNNAEAARAAAAAHNDGPLRKTVNAIPLRTPIKSKDHHSNKPLVDRTPPRSAPGSRRPLTARNPENTPPQGRAPQHVPQTARAERPRTALSAADRYLNAPGSADDAGMDYMHPYPLEGGTPAAAAPSSADAAWAEAHAVLDRLEREAILDLQLELSGLLTERSHLLADRTSESVVEWRAQLAMAAGEPPPPPSIGADVTTSDGGHAERRAVRVCGRCMGECDAAGGGQSGTAGVEAAAYTDSGSDGRCQAEYLHVWPGADG